MMGNWIGWWRVESEIMFNRSTHEFLFSIDGG